MKRILKNLAVLSLLMSPCMSYAANGELWETHSTMNSKAYGEMDMGSNRECRPANWRDNPEFKAPGDQSACKSKMMKRQGNRYQWSFDCGKTRGQGSAELKGRDRMLANMQMDTPQGHFDLVVESRKVGRCLLD